MFLCYTRNYKCLLELSKRGLKITKIGYARVSSKEQHLDRQLAALKDVDKLFTDKLSGANTNRPELQKMLAYIREGDIVLVTELDRLGRNNQDLTKIMNTIQNRLCPYNWCKF